MCPLWRKAVRERKRTPSAAKTQTFAAHCHYACLCLAPRSCVYIQGGSRFCGASRGPKECHWSCLKPELQKMPRSLHPKRDPRSRLCPRRPSWLTATPDMSVLNRVRVRSEIMSPMKTPLCGPLSQRSIVSIFLFYPKPKPKNSRPGI